MLIPIDIMCMALPRAKNVTVQRYWSQLAAAMEAKAINSARRQAMFLAQIGHESIDLSATVENLNYSETALVRTWPKRFPEMDLAMEYRRQPEKIANYVYSNRMGNGPPESGDGWLFRGRGLIQITGRTNYTAFAKSVDFPVQEIPAFLETPSGACKSAAWFWTNINGNKHADALDIISNTQAINGGLNGIQDRKDRHQIAMDVLEKFYEGGA